MTAFAQLLELNKKSAKGFHQQKKVIAAVMKGKTEYCQHCHQVLSLKPISEQCVEISCAKQCTHILLDL